MKLRDCNMKFTNEYTLQSIHMNLVIHLEKIRTLSTKLTLHMEKLSTSHSWQL